MFEQYFDTKTTTNEQFIVDSILEHTMIDEEELYLLKNMLSGLCEGKHEDIEQFRDKILSIRNDSNHIFEHLEEQISKLILTFKNNMIF